MNNNLLITDLDMQGLGIGHDGDKTIFVFNAIPEEIVEYDKIKENKNLIFANTKNIIKQSKNRVTPPCPYFLECGGCDIQHLEYLYGLNFKKNQIKLAFKKICNEILPDFEIVGSEKEYSYRNKIALKICKIENENSLCYYKKNSHQPIKIEYCKICDRKFDFVIKQINNYLKTLKVESYNEKTKKGVLKHFVGRIIDDKLLITFVLNKKIDLPNLDKLYASLLSNFKSVGINININHSGSQILSDNFINLLGENEISFENLSLNQKISNASFLQVNTPIANKIYNFVLENVDKPVVNAYSGAGLLSGLIAKNTNHQVYGIEINKFATKLSEKLKKDNNILNLTNYCDDAGTCLEKLNLKDFDLVLDPPKSGIDDKMIDCINKFLPNKIIYISCDKIVLAKNFNKLKNNYNIYDIKAFDMFPQTKNVETVVVLKRK